MCIWAMRVIIWVTPLMIACAKMGMHFVACAPKKYFPDEALVKECQEFAAISGATITLTEDVAEAVKGS